MGSFNNFIGYESVKLEMSRICDVIKNKEKYKKLGVTIPHGLLLYGKPGVGKTLLANCFIEECGLKAFVCRKNLPNGEFVKQIKDAFEMAKNNAPSIVFLDDFDKFANNDKDHLNTDEFVTIQTCIDDIKESDVFVLATSNNLVNIPESLLRAGRFDVSIYINTPKGVDAEKIIEHYISQKGFVDDIDIGELARILNGKSCAELETVINQAGIYAGFENKEKIEFQDIMRACIREIYDSPETIKNHNFRDDEKVAFHEAGHAVISELLEPGNVTMISIGGHEGDLGGFTAYYRDDEYWHSVERMRNRVLCLLGGKCATELKYGVVDVGSTSDIERAIEIVKRIITEYAELGFDKCNFRAEYKLSQKQLFYQECAVSAELEKCYLEVKKILVENRKFLDMLAIKLNEKKLLIAQDIKEIRKSLSFDRQN